MRKSPIPFYVMAFVLAAVIGMGYAYGADCTKRATATCPGYGANNAINGNCCVVLYDIPADCSGSQVKNVTVCSSDLCGVLAPVNSSGNCGTNTTTGCGQLAACVGCTSKVCE